MTTNGAPAAAIISAWEQDPGSANHPDGGQLIQQPVPQLGATSLPVVISHPSAAPAPKVYAPGTPEFRYWSAAASLSRGSVYWSGQLPGVKWQVGNKLPVDLDHGDDLNAYYDRIGLKFFHGTVGARTVYSCESPDVVCHEQGHAVLDSIKPQLWNAASIEVAAFHESFGDMSAMLCALQLPTLRHAVITETGGVVYRSSRLSRLAEQLGWAIRQSYPAAVEPDCLRNAVNSFFYHDPQTLPSSGPASTLSSEPHSFSRVFTAAFLESIANMFRLRAAQDEANLLQVSTDVGQILVGGIRASAVVPTFFSQVAANMMHFAAAKFTDIAYSQALKSAFVRHGIISPSASSAFAQSSPALGLKEMAQAENESKELPKLRLSVAEYGLGVDTITVHSAAEPKRFDVAGAALSIGSVVPPAQDEAAKAFVEDLLRRGRLKVVQANDKGGALAINRPNEPETHDSHTHELRAVGNEYELIRVRIDCGRHS